MYIKPFDAGTRICLVSVESAYKLAKPNTCEIDEYWYTLYLMVDEVRSHCTVSVKIIFVRQFSLFIVVRLTGKAYHVFQVDNFRIIWQVLLFKLNVLFSTLHVV